MKRRDFLKTGVIAAGVAGPLKVLEPLVAEAAGAAPAPPARAPATQDNRSPDYLRRAQAEPLLPKAPVVLEAGSDQIKPMPLAERIRRKIVPQRGFCSLSPTSGVLLSENGAVNIELTGDPNGEQIPFRHELMYLPRRRPAEAPKIAEILPQVRQMLLDGKYHEAAQLALQRWRASSGQGGGGLGGAGGGGGGGFSMRLELPRIESVRNYLRTVDFESTEVKTYHTDDRGEWVRGIFTSRPDNVVVQSLTAPQGQKVNVRIALGGAAAGGRGGAGGRRGAGAAGGGRAGGPPAGGRAGGGQGNIQQDLTEQGLIMKGLLDPAGTKGYAGVTRVVRDGGAARIEDNTLVIENANSLLLLTRVEVFPEYAEDKVESVRQALEQLPADYAALLERARKVQSEMLNRVTVDFDGAAQYGLSSEELLSAQRASSGYSGAYLKSLFEMCRYWFILTSGTFASMSAEINANINLQMAPGPQGDHREGMEAYFNWMESLFLDFRTNAKNIFGTRGAHYSLIPSKEWGVETMFDQAGTATTGEIWPHAYWLSGGPWCARLFWEQYLVSGDREFLRKRVVPAYKDLAEFYEDFLTVTDKNGNYTFVPSFSPENNPGNLNPSCMTSINASMDIATCREVLSVLVQSCELLGIEAEGVAKWKALLAKLPPYLLEPDGTLKEWSWPTLGERYVHRHVSHLYGIWPADEIDPDRTPQLAKAALMADRHRIPERLAAHGRCHRALVGARLKDCYMVDSELRQLIEEGYVGPTLRCSHDPYSSAMPDAQGGIPTIIMEMLAYARPGVIEVLPALPPSLVKGSINGMQLHTFARLDKLAWDMEARTVDLTVTSRKVQDVTLIARYGIESINAPATVLAAAPRQGASTCDLHLPEGTAVNMSLKLGRRNPLEWVNWVA